MSSASDPYRPHLLTLAPRSKRLRAGTLLAFVAATLVAGCGASGYSPPADENAKVRAEVTAKALKVMNEAHDRYLPGKNRIVSKCKLLDGATAERRRYSCRANGYTQAVTQQIQHQRPTLGVADEEWLATVDAEGGIKTKIGHNGYAISIFLENDNLNGCSAGKSLNC